ncbi:MAG: nuclear transport factor 2 family protein [Chitinimonas sp.]|nr:nuclear transport factor 2 family protein [Chitinimonas sp.]
MHPHAALIQRFYQAFQRQDAEAMAACYHPDVVFDDPVFIGLRGHEAGDMWRMLCSRAKQFSLQFDEVVADDHGGSAHWIARYEFRQTGHMVVNDIRASFEFRDGLIVRHRDVFDLWRWSRMALGGKGVLLGWLPPVQGAIRKQALAGLAAYQRKRATSA